MAYTTNPHLPRVRMDAVEMVRSGKSVREVARHFGFAHNTVLGWCKKKPVYGSYGALVIPTRSSRPQHHPHALSQDIIDRILVLRAEKNQCAEILHWRLAQEGVFVSLSSVKRTLTRCGLSRYSKWKKWHIYPERPEPETPGILVEIDTVHTGPCESRLYVYTLLDVCSRWAHAEPMERISTHRSIRFVHEARDVSPFQFATLQSDHGPEFSRWLTKQCEYEGIAHRHSRVRTPTDNGHLERFNRTIQQECLRRIPRNLRSWKREIPEYLRYYNEERPHMGLSMRTPMEVVRSY